MHISGVGSSLGPIFVVRLAVDKDDWDDKSETSVERFETSRFRSGPNVCMNSWMEGTVACGRICTGLDFEDGGGDEGCPELMFVAVP